MSDALPEINWNEIDLPNHLTMPWVLKNILMKYEKEGFLETMQGKGSFVAAQNKELMKEKKLKIIEEKLAEVVEESQLLGLKYTEINEMLKILFEEE